MCHRRKIGNFKSQTTISDLTLAAAVQRHLLDDGLLQRRCKIIIAVAGKATPVQPTIPTANREKTQHLPYHFTDGLFTYRIVVLCLSPKVILF